MPIQKCNSDGKPGYKYGDSGHCYTYTPGDEKSRKEAKKKCIKQGLAIDGPENFASKASLEDVAIVMSDDELSSQVKARIVLSASRSVK